MCNKRYFIMGRPISNSKHRRNYFVVVTDHFTGERIFFERSGYLRFVRDEFFRRFPFADIRIYTLSVDFKFSK